jgi:hypothetical protein
MRNNLIIIFIFFAACRISPDVPDNVTDTLKKVTTDTTVVKIVISESDKQLAEFEKLINTYIVVSEKAKEGDVPSLSECTSVSVKAKNLELSLLNQADKLSTGQQNKLKELAVKFERVSYEK